LNPRLDGFATPDATARQMDLGFREVVVGPLDLVYPLSGDTEHLGDFCHSDQMMRHGRDPTVDM